MLPIVFGLDLLDAELRRKLSNSRQQHKARLNHAETVFHRRYSKLTTLTDLRLQRGHRSIAMESTLHCHFTIERSKGTQAPLVSGRALCSVLSRARPQWCR